ncbi:MAG: bile acid:sodium symporter [Planctomycetes bacterium]|nr:bile acid:sodium symporter [Planctomycetota bacterium]MCH9725318.1 bile acid:sodium symporter [Planctomycetota bacterium]MCH9779462.1 bile acid:sodium symporter [Planctomycetota bacterium]MCH9792174.1 bile acid:sodium symporter [Planctomycetota bacterium]
MLAFLRRRWFLAAITLVILSGVLLGYHEPAENLLWLKQFIRPSWLTAIVLFLMSLSLNSEHLLTSIRKPAPLCLSLATNIILLPLLAWALLPLQLTPDFQVGLIIMAVVPCTLCGASVWTRRAAGNDGLSLMVTMITNGACFLTIPFWILLITAREIEFNQVEMITKLFYAAMLPVVIGQAFRLNTRMKTFADRITSRLGTVALIFVLLMVLLAAVQTGQGIKTSETGISFAAIVIVWTSCTIVHVTGFFSNMFLAKTFRFHPRDQIAGAIAGSQKTLPIAIFVATDASMFGNAGMPSAVFPLLMFHTSQFFIDTIFADRHREKYNALEETENSDQEAPTRSACEQ